MFRTVMSMVQQREDMYVEIKDGNTKSFAVPADDSGTRQMLGNKMACKIHKMMLKDRIRWKSRTGKARRIRRARRIRAVMDMENDNPTSKLFLTNWRCNTCSKVLMHDDLDVLHCLLCEKEVPYEQVELQRWQFGSW